jgi:hypothetical protein
MGKVIVGFLVLTIFLLSAFASAQQAPGPPIPLIPPAPPPSAEPGPPPPSQPAITSERLPSPASGWSGDLAPPERALPADFWHGTPRALAEILLGRLPETTSAALQSLERRLLLSPAAAPEGPDMAEMNLPALRAAALLRLGEIDAARAVLAAMPKKERDAGLRLAVAADAIAGHLGRACATAERAIRGDQDAFWQKALIACQALQGKTEEARLGVRLLAEEKLPPDKALSAAIDALAGHPAAPAMARLDHPTPLLLRLIVKARLRLARKLVASLSPDLALTLALDEAAPPATRLAAAERAARLGALPPARLAALYTDLTGTAAGGEDPSLMRARRFAAIADAASAGDRLARIVAFARDFAGPQGDGFAVAARLVLPQMRGIAPDPALAGSAAGAARLALAAGDNALARRWSALLPGAERKKLDFVLTLATPDNNSSAEDANVQGIGPPVLRLALLSALGRPVPARVWLHLPANAWSAGGPPGIPITPWLALSSAVPAKRIGESVLASLLVAGTTGRLSHDPLVLNAAIGGIERVGLDAAARRIAVEAALAAGL